MRPRLAFLQDRAGKTAIEYSMIAALIAILLVSAISSMGLSLEKMITPLEKAIGAPKA
ncbi:MAG: Flp family type IVb pilin [Alphaproteobacteria bacterium]|nr:Flp family type IVb pilin [Alphaproteobacteria bacterium]